MAQAKHHILFISFAVGGAKREAEVFGTANEAVTNEGGDMGAVDEELIGVDLGDDSLEYLLVDVVLEADVCVRREKSRRIKFSI